MAELLAMTSIEKRFGGVHALKGVDFKLQRGEVHAVLGENGAGKSTLIKILSGAYQPDEGRIVLDGKPVSVRDPRSAQALGVATIYQEGSLYPDLSVLENLFMGRQPRTRLGTLDWSAMRQQAGEIFGRLQVTLPLTRRAGDLSRAQIKLVEIARALLREARLIVMDEPTAALPADDVERLFDIVRNLRDEGVAVIYISHRLEEIFSIADTVTVLRDGEKIASKPVDEVSHAELIHMMVGRTLRELYPHSVLEPGPPLLEVHNLSRVGVFEDISFTVHAGEVVGMAGLVGSGRSEVARAVFGIDPYHSGSILLEGKPLPAHPWQTVEAGLALLPEDRSHQGLVLPFAVRQNVTLATLKKISTGGILREGEELNVAGRFIQALSIRTPGPQTVTDNLSGGNQQKVVLAKWLAATPRVLILDEPTQGVDVGAKSEIHHLIDKLVKEGIGVLLISSDLEEILGMADRILVMHRGRLASELPRGSSAEDVMRAATGLVDTKRAEAASVH